MIKTLPIAKAREELIRLVNNAKRKRDEYVITVNGIPAAVLMSADEYDSWKETNEILADPGLMESIRRGEEDLKAGRMYDWDDVKEELGFVNDKNVQNKNFRTRKKRT